MTCVSSPGPLPPAAVHWLSMGHPDRLSASWGAAAGGRDGYTLTLYHVWLGTVAATASLGRDTHNFTFMGLTPGYEYSLEASAMAGPYQAAAPNISGWTRECPEDVPCRGVGDVAPLDSPEEGWEVYRGPGAFGDVCTHMHGCNVQQLVSAVAHCYPHRPMDIQLRTCASTC